MNSRLAVQVPRPDDIDLARILGLVLDNRRFIVSITLLFTFLGVLYSLLATPIYRADALIQVEQKSADSLLKDISSLLPDAKPQSLAEVEIIKSRMVIGKTVDDLALDIEAIQQHVPLVGKGIARLLGYPPASIVISQLRVPPRWLDEPLTLEVLDNRHYRVIDAEGRVFEGQVDKLAHQGEIALLINAMSAPPGTRFVLRKLNPLTAITDVLEHLSVGDKGKDTGVLGLSLEGEDIRLTSQILNSISQNYLQQNVARKSEEAARSLTFLRTQLPEIRNTLNDAENKLNAYRQANESLDLSLEAKAMLDTLVAVESQLNELTFKEAEISKRYTHEHPAYRALMEKRSTLENEREKLNQRVSSMPKTQQEILRLTRDVEVGQEIYMQLLNKQQELSINKASTVGNVRIIDPAVVQPWPVKPKKIWVVLLFMVMGTVAAISCVLLKTVLHKGIESPEQLEERDISVYACVPFSTWQQQKDKALLAKNKKNNTRASELLAVGNPADMAIEAIRSLRTSLHFAMIEAKNNVLMISGASPSIGKTFISTNLGAVIALAGQRVLIVDCDMRKGYAHALMGAKGTDGLSDVLSGYGSLEHALRKTSIATLDFIPRGQIPPNPSELLMHRHFTEFVQWAAQQYDLVLLDTPPILAVTDAAIISRHAGTTLLVARYGVNTVKEVEVSIRRFEQNGSTVKGVILNAMIKRATHYYGEGNYYAYDYHSGRTRSG